MSNEGPYRRIVRASGKLCEITVYRKSPAVWEAVGDFNGETYRSKGGSLTQAENRWVRQVEYHFHRN